MLKRLARMCKWAWEKVKAAAIATAKFVGGCLGMVGDALTISVAPLYAFTGDPNQGHAAYNAAKATFSGNFLTSVGHGTQWVAAHGVTFSTKLGGTKLATLLGKVVAAKTVVVGTAVIGGAYCLLFIAAVWAVKHWWSHGGGDQVKEFVDACAGGEGLIEVCNGLVLAEM
jgi:hypothetical protein